MQAHPNTIARQAAEKQGGWLPLYIVAEPSNITGATCRCYYCWYGVNEGHADDCYYMANCYELGLNRHERGYGRDKEILVPAGGLRGRIYSMFL